MKTDTATLKEQDVSLLVPFFPVHWQRSPLQILTSISEPLQRASESKDEAFIQATTLGFTSAPLCLSTNTVLHCGVSSLLSAAGLPLLCL